MFRVVDGPALSRPEHTEKTKSSDGKKIQEFCRKLNFIPILIENSSWWGCVKKAPKKINNDFRVPAGIINHGGEKKAPQIASKFPAIKANI